MTSYAISTSPSTRNRLSNVNNPYQSSRKKVLAVCSAGLLRSPTIAFILSNEPFGFNTRACGISSEYALIKIDDALILWADEIVVVEEAMKTSILNFNSEAIVHVLETPDQYEYRAEKLISFLTPKLKDIFLENITT